MAFYDVAGGMRFADIPAARRQGMLDGQEYRKMKMLQEHGPGIMNGDAASLAELSRFDPGAASTIQTRIASNARAAKNQASADLDKNLERDMKVAEIMTRMKTPDEWNRMGAYLRDRGLADAGQLIGKFDEMAPVFAGLTQNGTPEKIRELQQYVSMLPEDQQAAAMQLGIGRLIAGSAVTFENGKFNKIGGDGTTINNFVPNEQQAKTNLYYTRGTASNNALNKNDEKLVSFGGFVAGQAGVIGNYLKSKDYQLAELAGREFLAAILRKDTGAAVTDQEMQIYGLTFLPQPGDHPETIIAKRKRRDGALMGLETTMSAQQQQGLQALGIGRDPLPSDPKVESVTDLRPEQIRQMSAEQLAGLNKSDDIGKLTSEQLDAIMEVLAGD